MLPSRYEAVFLQYYISTLSYLVSVLCALKIECQQLLRTPACSQILGLLHRTVEALIKLSCIHNIYYIWTTIFTSFIKGSILRFLTAMLHFRWSNHLQFWWCLCCYTTPILIANGALKFLSSPYGFCIVWWEVQGADEPQIGDSQKNHNKCHQLQARLSVLEVQFRQCCPSNLLLFLDH